MRISSFARYIERPTYCYPSATDTRPQPVSSLPAGSGPEEWARRAVWRLVHPETPAFIPNHYPQHPEGPRRSRRIGFDLGRGTPCGCPWRPEPGHPQGVPLQRGLPASLIWREMWATIRPESLIFKMVAPGNGADLPTPLGLGRGFQESFP